MSSRPLIKPFSVITNGDMSANITSAVTIIDNLALVSYACSWAGTSPVGAVTIQVSNDYSLNVDGSVHNAGTWNTLPLSSSTNVSGNTGVGFIDIDANAGYALRFVYTRVSGIGTMQCILTAKVS